jgi:hypothetical protein
MTAVACCVNMLVLPLRIANHHQPTRHGSSFCRNTTFSKTRRMTRRLSTHFGPSHLDLSYRPPRPDLNDVSCPCKPHHRAATGNTTLPARNAVTRTYKRRSLFWQSTGPRLPRQSFHALPCAHAYHFFRICCSLRITNTSGGSMQQDVNGSTWSTAIHACITVRHPEC